MIDKMTVEGTKNLLAYCVFSAIHNKDDEWFNEDIGSNILFFFEQLSGITYKTAKELVETRRNNNYMKNKSSITEDAKTMTLSQLAATYNVSKAGMKTFCNRNQIRYQYVN